MTRQKRDSVSRQAMHILAVDFQKDFTGVGGPCYLARPCVQFIREVLLPCCRNQGIRIAEIISDYRPPRPGAHFAHCVPGTSGYESEIPNDVKQPQVWVKCMHSPLWVRENGGLADKVPGIPYQDTAGFTDWLATVVGPPEKDSTIVLIGLTLDCCLLCTAQELFFRGYRVEFLVEAVDTYSGKEEEKELLFDVPLVNWGQPVFWLELRERMIS